MSNATIQEIVDGYVEASKHDHVGLWEIIGRVGHDLHLSGPEGRSAVLQVVKGIMSAGTQAVTSSKTGFHAWDDQDPDRALVRISTEWDALGRDPDPGDIVWFGPNFEFAKRPT